MGVFDPDGREVIWDPKAGRPVEVGTPRWAEIREDMIREMIAKMREETARESIIPLTRGKDLRDAAALAESYRKIRIRK